MTFEENPFRVLNVSIYADKATIIERADDLSFADPDREEIIEHARDILLNPRKRIAAEVRWFVGCSQAKELKYIANHLSKRTPDDEACYDDEDYSSLSELNFTIYAVDNENYFGEWVISNIESYYFDLDADEIRGQINATRKKSNFPEVQDTAEIKTELKNLRYEIRERLHKRLKAMPRYGQVKLTTDLIEIFIGYEDDIGVIVEDFFDSYRLEITPFLDDTRSQIISLLNKIKINAHAKFTTELAAQVKAFAEATRPLDKFSEALGTNDFAATEKIFYTVRDTAIKLFNDKDLINDPLIITRLLEQNFSYLPHLAALIRKDIQFLEETKARRPTQDFLDAKAALDKILSELKKNLRFKRGADNINFYIDVFKPRHQVKLQSLMIQCKYKPDEWQYLNALAAAIYLQVVNAMTWTRRADLAFDSFQKALPYVEASGDKELSTSP